MTRRAQGLARAAGVAGPASVREADDFYSTAGAADDAGEVVDALLDAESAWLPKGSRIWEPAAGDGAMVRPLRRRGFRVIASDLVDRGCGAIEKSFYDWRRPPARLAITNPPFAECMASPHKARWIRHALEVLRLDYLALLLPWSWPCAAGLREIWDRTPPARVYAMTWRIDWDGRGSPPMPTGWFVWDRDAFGQEIMQMRRAS